jgi:outer membrane biosynthesis protein TonB
MSKDRFSNRSPKVFYRQRILLAFIAAELLVWGVFIYWPSSEADVVSVLDRYFDRVTFEDVMVTVQLPAAAAPPRPRVPVLAPEYEIVEEDVLIEDIKLPDLSVISESEITGAGKADGTESGAPVQNPSRPPNVLKIVEPTLPAAARSIRAEITVRFLVNTDGFVEEVSISEIRLFDKKMNATVAQEVGSGVDQAVLEAAYEWRFRPAKNLGKSVRAYSSHIFSIGF